MLRFTAHRAARRFTNSRTEQRLPGSINLNRPLHIPIPGHRKREDTHLAGLFDREIYLDIETLRLSSEVDGGWGNIRAFGLAVAITWDKDNAFRRWYEEDALKLITELELFTHVITFNGNRFDLEVLRAYAPVEGLRQRSMDIHELLHKQLGHRVKLDQLAKETLGTSKSGDGLDAVKWWRAGQKDRVAEYCEQDVAILRDVVEHGRAKGFVVISAKQVRVPWE